MSQSYEYSLSLCVSNTQYTPHIEKYGDKTISCNYPPGGVIATISAFAGTFGNSSLFFRVFLCHDSRIKST